MNVTGKYLKVWKVEERNGYIHLDLGDTRKDKNGEYENCTWFGCTLLGDAAKKNIKEGDKVEVKSGQIFQEKYNEKWYTKIKIFHIDVMESDQSNSFGGTPDPKKSTSGFGGFTPADKKPDPNSFEGSQIPFEDDIPF